MFSHTFRLFAISLPLALASANVSAVTCQPYNPEAPYQLVFEDNFNGNSLNRNLWTTEFLWGPSVIINNETQYYVNDGQFGYEPFSVTNGVLTIEANKTPFDPMSLHLTRSIYSPTSVELLWRLPTGAVRYEIYRDGVLQGGATGGSFLQDNLRDSIDYAYEVVALDSDDNKVVSAQLTVNTSDRGVPASEPVRPGALGLAARIYSATSGEIVWYAPNRAGSFKVYRDGRLYRTLNGSTYQSLYEAGLEEGRRYVYTVVAFDRCGEKITHQNVVLNTGNGVTPQPAKSQRLVIRTQVYSKSSAEILWNSVAGVRSYDIFEDGEFVKNIDGRSHYVNDLVPGIDRKFKVIAYDGDGVVVDETTRTVNLADNSFALNRQPHMSGMISSYKSFQFKYGRVEARARMPAGKGLWSAFFLLNAYYGQDQPEDPEIDIIEAIGDRLTTANNAYYYMSDEDGDGEFTDLVRTEFRSPMRDFSTDFRVYRVDWEPNLIVYYVDDVETARIEGSHVSSEQMYVLASLAVGGDFPGPADETTPWPARYELDYIRVYQRR